VGEPQRFDADVIVVGGGAAGCVVASRLSESRSLKVILVEAGPDVAPGSIPADIVDEFPRAYANPNYFWPPFLAPPHAGGQGRPFNQPRLLGGGSSVMGMWAVRGLPADYDAWRDRGAMGWGYDDVLPMFRRLERDLDIDDEAHGTEGPLPIRRRHPEAWPGFNRAIAKAAARRDLPYMPDMNACSDNGVFAIPNCSDEFGRATTATRYLNDAVRRRPNLSILTSIEARSIVFDGRRVTGVRVGDPDGTERSLSAPNVVLSAGAINSPALLLRSGVGPAPDLMAAGITPRWDLPAVGRNLQNHVVVHLGAFLRPSARQDPDDRLYGMSCLRTSADPPNLPGELLLGVVARTGPRRTDNRIGMLAAALYAPASRGAVTLPTPTGAPHVDFQMLEDELDRRRILAAARLARDLLQDPSVKAETFESFVLPADLPIRRLNRPGFSASLASIALAGVVDAGGPIRRAFLRAAFGSGRLLSALSTTADFEAVVLGSATTMFHPVGTCALEDVVDSDMRVRGVEGLFVIDASVMPQIPRANTHIPTVMIAEKGAELMLRRLKP
jgi:5-(hydroxymethyl)furfural/furfural oxidase